MRKETFRRWIGEGAEFQVRFLHNKNKNVIDDREMANAYYSPKRLFMKHEMAQYVEEEGKQATKKEKKAQREYLKAQFKVLPADIMDIYKKASRDKLAMHGFVEEAIVETLNDNNEQAFRALEKVFVLQDICTSLPLSILTDVNPPLPLC